MLIWFDNIYEFSYKIIVWVTMKKVKIFCYDNTICPVVSKRLADQKQELSKKFTELLMEKQDNILELNKQLADQKAKIRKWLSKNASLRDRNWMLKEFEELK